MSNVIVRAADVKLILYPTRSFSLDCPHRNLAETETGGQLPISAESTTSDPDIGVLPCRCSRAARSSTA